ncbi:MAG: tetratricopeptide repeat protein [Chloroflexi bacterium]|nr:tetratricopeptide repeat protein [Chloroflexota bacterium]
MGTYFAIVFSQLDRDASVWARTPRDRMAATIAEYKYLAESVASQYGSLHRNFTADGHLFLFEDADAAVRFSLKLIETWRASGELIPLLTDLPHVPLRVGCHFGECTLMVEGEWWTGRGIALARQVAGAARPDTVYLTGSVLDLVDLPLYRFEEAESSALEGDHLPHRPLYRVAELHEAPAASSVTDGMTAGAWFLKAAALIGTSNENSQQESDCYQEALRLRPDYPQAHNNLAVVLKARGEEAAAAEHYREALRLRPDYPEAHYNHAVLLHARGSVASAAEHYCEALRLQADYVDAHYGYANLLRAGGDLAGAKEHYCQTLRLRPDYAEVHNNYAILLEDMAQPARAREHYREALRIRPDYAEALYNYAFLRDNEGDPEEAEKHYWEALRLRPDYPEAHNNLAILLQSKGDLNGAEVHYQEALGLRHDDPETHYNYALLLKAKGDQAGAEEHLHMAYELAPMEWVVALQERAGSPKAGPLLNTTGLTPRELQVLRLIAVGRSNREVGEELVISLSTVAHHVTNILNKTGAANRTEAAAYAAHHGLVFR